MEGKTHLLLFDISAELHSSSLCGGRPAFPLCSLHTSGAVGSNLENEDLCVSAILLPGKVLTNLLTLGSQLVKLVRAESLTIVGEDQI